MDTAHLKILLVDDNEDAYVLTRALLRSIQSGPGDLDWESSYEAGLERVLGGEHDAVLVDYRLGGKAGTALIREAIVRGCTTPMIMVTGEVGRDVDLEAMEAGAADYLVKGRFDGYTLERSLRYAIQRRQRKALEEQIRGGHQMNAVGRLAAGLSGELNDLAATISGHAEMLLRYFGPEEDVREDAVAIHLASTRLAELTEQLLAFARSDEGTYAAIDLNDVVTGLAEHVAHTLKKGVRLKLSRAEDLDTVMGDAQQLDRVIRALITNAEEATRGRARITLSTENVVLQETLVATNTTAAAGPYVALTVRDEGEGMSAATRRQIFEPFFTTREMGRGMGLSFVFGAVAGCGGHIEVRSVLGEGTSVRLLFPSAAERSRVDLSVIDDDAPPSEPGEIVVLVVQSQPRLRGFLLRALRDHGYAVLTAPDGRTALETVSTHPGTISAVVADLALDDMDGWKLSHDLRSSHEDMPILLLCSPERAAEITLTAARRNVVTMRKPFRVDAFLETIEALMKPVSGGLHLRDE